MLDLTSFVRQDTFSAASGKKKDDKDTDDLPVVVQEEESQDTKEPKDSDPLADPPPSLPVKVMLQSTRDRSAPASLHAVSYRQLLREAALARSTSVTYGGVTPLELAFGRRPADMSAVIWPVNPACQISQ